MVSFTWDDKDFKRDLNELMQRAPEVVKAQLMLEGEAIMNEAKRLTPVDTGTLRASGRVVMVNDGVVLQFGGAASGYAIYVHEDLEAHHPVGQAKFLEVPFERHVSDPQFIARIGQAVENATG